MRFIFMTFYVVLLSTVIVRAFSMFHYSRENNVVDYDSSTEDESFGKMETHPRLKLMREKLKKLKLNNADKARRAPQVAAGPLSYRNIERSVFAPVEEINEPFADYLYQSDILLTEEQVDNLLSANKDESNENDEDSNSVSTETTSDETMHHKRIKRKVKSNRRYKWSTKKPISYYISADLTPAKKQVIVSAVNFWQHHTCLTFREVETLEDSIDLIHFINGEGCFSGIGRVGGSQNVSVADGCEHLGFGIVSHEIGHALGFWHEQARSDRDSFVEVRLVNIKPDKEGDFAKQAANSIKTYDIPYEYGSIMHYGANSFAISQAFEALIAKNERFQQTMGQRTAPSFFDVYQVNRHYECLDKCSAAITSCQNGGYPNPKTCNKCICPTGFGGDLCSDPQTTQSENCGQRITATEDWQLLEASVGENLPWKPTENNPAVWKPVVCSWHITAPVSKTVEVLVSENSAQCNFGCTLNALQIKTNINYKMTGMRVCCRNDNRNYIYQSEGNLMPIIAEAYYHFSFKLQYRISPEDSEKSKDEDATSTIEPASEPYQESECQAAGGVCKYSDDCNSGITDAMLCPKQSKNIHCCLAPPETTTTGEPESVETGITLGIIGKTVEDLMDLRTFELHPSEGGCLWIGEAPFCSRDCPDDYDFIREHNGRCGNGWFADTCVPDSSFGKSCSTVLGSKFKKRFCCRSDSRDCTWSGRWVDTNNAIMDCKYDHTEDRCGRLTCSANHRNSTTSLIGGINCNQLEMLDYSGKATCGFIAWSDGNRWYKTNR